MDIETFSLELGDLEVVLKNDVLRYREKWQGIYQKDKIVNGRLSWKTETKAIWFEGGNWLIGNLEEIGTAFCSMYSYCDVDHKTPLDVPSDKWMYLNVETVSSGDITLKLITGK